jgi:NADH-quinone oxidoreductase subunit A
MSFKNIDSLYMNNWVYYSYWNEQYIYIFYYIVFSFGLCFVLFLLAFILSPKEITFEKTSPYECGFEPFGDGHLIFNIQFFIVGILFMLFDLELAYLFPWMANIGNLNYFSFFIVVFFLILLTIGLIYEWKKGALNWI